MFLARATVVARCGPRRPATQAPPRCPPRSVQGGCVQQPSVLAALLPPSSTSAARPPWHCSAALHHSRRPRAAAHAAVGRSAPKDAAARRMTTTWSKSMDKYDAVGTKQVSPAADRNKQPILDVLRRFLPEKGTVLELASGSGQHVSLFAQELPGLSWLPTDCEDDMFGSIRAYTADLANVAPPALLDASADSASWPAAAADAIVAINMCQVSPWAATEGLFRGAGKILPPGGVLYVYGPLKQDGVHTSEGNATFDAALQHKNPEWGVRDVADLVKLGEAAGLQLAERVAMPANNTSLVFRKL